MDFGPTTFKDKPDLSTPLRAAELNKFGAGIVEGITKAEAAKVAADSAKAVADAAESAGRARFLGFAEDGIRDLGVITVCLNPDCEDGEKK